MRKLVTLQVVKEVLPIEGADRIELVRYEDVAWQNVAKKGEFKAGDRAIYIEIDSLLPMEDPFLFLGEPRDFKYKDSRGRPCFRLKTKRMKGVLSQGLALPYDELYLSMGIEKYEPEEASQLQGVRRSTFPSDILPKTDEERIQSNMKYLEMFKGKPYSATLKMDGTSATYLIKDGEFMVCSRNQALVAGDNVYWQMAKKYDIERICREDRVAIQGEICGPGIQKNRMGLAEVDLFVFDVIDMTKSVYFSNLAIDGQCGHWGLNMVPWVARVDAFNSTYAQLQEISDKLNYFNGAPAEGMVLRLDEEHGIRVYPRPSFKVISNRFLLNGGE